MLGAGAAMKCEWVTTAHVDALPPEAVEWAKELLRQGYRDEHIVTFSESGYGLEHPIRCRPNLIGCAFNRWLATAAGPDREPGRYVMTWTNTETGFPEYAATERPAASPEAAGEREAE
jgi:hypothetical protein